MDTRYLANQDKSHKLDSVFALSDTFPRFEVLWLYDVDKFPCMSFFISKIIENIIMNIV
jgi:hypothetical protein